MSNKSYRNIGVAIIVAILAVGTYFYLSTQENDQGTSVSSNRPAPVVKKTNNLPESPPGEEVTPEDKPETNESSPSESATEVPAEAFDQEFQKEQKRIITSYQSLTRLEVDLPQNMVFREIDTDDEVAILYGSEIIGEGEMAIVASKRTAGPEAIADFLNQNKGSFPMLKTSGFKITGEIRTLSAPEETGIGKITLIPGGKKNGKEVWAAHLQRKDNGGSYLFIMEDRSSVFSNNEGRFDSMLDSLKTK